jgi:hypothetical protein
MADPLEKLEAAVKKLASEMSEFRDGQDELKVDVSGMQDAQGDILAMLKGIQRTQTALTTAMTSAVKELATNKTLEVRVRRLEDAVFGSKHEPANLRVGLQVQRKWSRLPGA